MRVVVQVLLGLDERIHFGMRDLAVPLDMLSLAAPDDLAPVHHHRANRSFALLQRALGFL